MATTSAWLSGSSPCSRDRSISSLTRVVRRAASWCIRPANRRTASGSSLASSTASASSDSAPTGVFSSWLTLATKSRRTSSTRRASERSSTITATRPAVQRGDPGFEHDWPGRSAPGPRLQRKHGGRIRAARGADGAQQRLERDPLPAYQAQHGGRRGRGRHAVVGVDHEPGRAHRLKGVRPSAATSAGAGTGGAAESVPQPAGSGRARLTARREGTADLPRAMNTPRNTPTSTARPSEAASTSIRIGSPVSGLGRPGGIRRGFARCSPVRGLPFRPAVGRWRAPASYSGPSTPAIHRRGREPRSMREHYHENLDAVVGKLVVDDPDRLVDDGARHDRAARRAAGDGRVGDRHRRRCRRAQPRDRDAGDRHHRAAAAGGR